MVSDSHSANSKQLLTGLRHDANVAGTDPLIDWISDTLSQEYTNLQSLLKCLDHTNIVSDTVCSQAKVVLGCAMH